MAAWFTPLVERALHLQRRLRERAGLVASFADASMHLWMLSDRGRGEAFDAALRATVRPGQVVADVGTGTGLLAMMACRAGAARVYAIEERGVVALARTLVERNGFADRVVFVEGSSLKATLPERVDVVVSETIGAFVFSEGIVETLADARRRFLKPGGAMIPSRIRIQMAPIESFEEGTGMLERPVHGFDYSAARPKIDTSVMAPSRGVGRAHFLAGEQLLYDLDFAGGAPPAGFSRRLAFTAARAGTLHGFLGFWEADLAAGVTLRCVPDAPPGHWMPLIFRLPAGLPVAAGDRIELEFDRAARPGWSWRWQGRVAGGRASSP